MAGERTYAILPCRTLDDVVPFYEALGFVVTYRQERPNPYLVVRREDLHLHFAAIDGFDPEQSYASVIVVVPDAEALYQDFAAGLRAAYGKLPTTKIPRLLRPRRKRGTVSGFSVVDPGGNWLRDQPSGRHRGRATRPARPPAGGRERRAHRRRQGRRRRGGAHARQRPGAPRRGAGRRTAARAGVPGGAGEPARRRRRHAGGARPRPASCRSAPRSERSSGPTWPRWTTSTPAEARRAPSGPRRRASSATPSG